MLKGHAQRLAMTVRRVMSVGHVVLALLTRFPQGLLALLLMLLRRRLLLLLLLFELSGSRPACVSGSRTATGSNVRHRV